MPLPMHAVSVREQDEQTKDQAKDLPKDQAKENKYEVATMLANNLNEPSKKVLTLASPKSVRRRKEPETELNLDM